MLFNVFGNSSSSYDNNKIDTFLFVQKPYLRTNYIESDIEESLNMKNQFKIKNLPYPELKKIQMRFANHMMIVYSTILVY